MQSPDILQGDIKKCLFYLSVPLVCSMFMDTFNTIIDALWLGKSSTEALAAVNLAAFPIWMMYAVMGIVCVGVNSLLAQKIGEASISPKNQSDADAVASLGIGMSLCLGVILAAGVIWKGRSLLAFMAGPDSPLVDLGYSYLAFIFLFAPIYSLSEVLMAILRAHGDTKTPMHAYFIGCGLNIVLDPLFIFGWGPIPRWDILGAALASNVAFLIATLWMLWLIGRGRLKYRLPASRQRCFSWSIIGSILRIGSPPALASCVFSAVYMLLSPTISSFGTPAVAAIGIGHKLESATYLFCYGVAMACVTMIGQNIGARQYERAKAIAWTGVRFALLFSSALGLLFWLSPEPLTALFSSDPNVLSEANNYVTILAPAQLFAGVCVLIDGIFAGVGKTWPCMCVSIPCSLMRVPIAYWVTYHLNAGVSGVWIAISAMCILRGAIMACLFVGGVWEQDESKAVPAQAPV
ncbi:MATE family efflux transporter [bacterium]|nr:MATE family efflux transporter [bacterium]